MIRLIIVAKSEIAFVCKEGLMELVQKQVRYMQEKPSITDQFQMDEDYNVPDTKDDVKQIVRSKETVKIEDINLIENYLRVSGKLCFQILYIVD